MDSYQSISEDSGCVVSQSEKSSSSCLHYTETPTSIYLTSRKRKFSHDNDHLRYSRETQTFTSYESPFAFEDSNANNFLSSTLNESLTKSLEKCYLYTPNFYVEHSPNENSEKRYKLDDSPKFQPKTRSAPSTPTKHLEDEELSPNCKSKSEPLSYCYFTPDVKVEKLGNQERFALLYPNIQPTISPTKLKTPEKLREFLKKVNSPAKKRLFDSSFQVERHITDPIVLFTVKNDLRHVVSGIFQYLSDLDLCSVSKVSKVWRRALHSDRKAFPRYYTYAQDYNSNKENVGESFSFREPDTPPLSPETDSFRRCTKIVSRLSPSQSLHKCLRCMEPAVIQKNVSQCQNPNCLYIYCRNCLSFSITGPEHFVDKCHMSELIVTKSNGSLLNRSRLYDISNGASSPPSFLLNDSFNLPQCKYDSSGYASELDGTPLLKRNLAVAHHQPLQPVSMNKVDNVIRRKIRRSSLVSVVSARTTTPQILEVIEPSSPPKVKDVACSKQSKKYLKRLKF
ncbi:hypothetical protein RI129_013041 [Pyrocoelia pectoralis]|uniref:F-box domain-containing protein n=1 Tax=Pyrocoelia pectoralis TaxID=417401 RepID=A0AAN7V575_9COLE